MQDSISRSENNPFCGDRIDLYVKIEDRKIKEIKFTGEGCTISIFSAELLSEYFVNKSLEEIKNFMEEQYLKLLPLNLTPTRQKCALLSFRILKKIVEGIEDKN